MELAIDGHGSSHSSLTWRRFITLLIKEAVDAKAPGSRILALEVQDLFEKGQTHLIVGVMRRACSVLFQALKAIFFKGL